jgi:3-(methylthio)propanoyl-CoA dehydrogenase
MRAKVATARFFGEHVLSQAPAVATSILSGGAGALALTAEDF